MQHARSEFPDQRWNPRPLQRKCGQSLNPWTAREVDTFDTFSCIGLNKPSFQGLHFIPKLILLREELIASPYHEHKNWGLTQVTNDGKGSHFSNNLNLQELTVPRLHISILSTALESITQWYLFQVGNDFHPMSWHACSVTQLCLTLCNPMDCSPPGSSVHGISQAGKLE